MTSPINKIQYGQQNYQNVQPLSPKKAEPNFGMSQPLEFLQQTTRQVDEKMAVEAVKAQQTQQFAFGGNNKEVNLPGFDTTLNLFKAPDGNRSPDTRTAQQGRNLFTFG